MSIFQQLQRLLVIRESKQAVNPIEKRRIFALNPFKPLSVCDSDSWTIFGHDYVCCPVMNEGALFTLSGAAVRFYQPDVPKSRQ